MASVLDIAKPELLLRHSPSAAPKASARDLEISNNLYRSVHLSRRDPAPLFYGLEARESPSSQNSSFTLPEHSAILETPAPTDYMDGNASGNNLLTMSESQASTSDAERQSSSSRQRSHSQTNSSARRQQLTRHPFHSPAVQNYPSSSTAQDTHSSPSAPPSTYQGPSPIYQSTSPFRHRGSFVGPAYTMSHQPPPLNLVHSPQYAYPPHPGMPGREASKPHIAYSSPSMMPMLQPHAPLYQFQNHSPEGSSTPQHSFAANPGPPPLYALSNPSPPPVSPAHGHPGQAGGAHTSTFTSAAPYSPMAYSSPHQYAYAASPPFATSPPMYQPQYAPAHYPQSFGPSGEQESQGTWWYMPPPGAATASSSYENMHHSFHPPYNMAFHPVAHRETEAYSNSGPSSTSPRQPLTPAARPASSQTSTVPDYRQPSSPSISRNSAVPATEDQESAAPQAPGEQARLPKRRPYHPNPPVQRSDWVMWAGNVPSDATHDELWRFFNEPPPPPHPPPDSDPSTNNESQVYGGVSSIFLISRSNCAFVNFESEQHLQAATKRFNGQPLRPDDPRCPKLVCRIRRPTDDLRSGVGGQRGIGVHAKWVKEQKEKARAEGKKDRPVSRSVGSSPEEVAGRIGSMTLSDDEGRRTGHDKASQSNSSDSFTSSNSGMLARYFPQRYFIMKSLTQVDLDISVQTGLWATQRHNEGILDQAYRTSQDVFLIFGVNKSGEFYGYARMAGPISRGEHSVDWPPVSPPPRSGHSQAPAAGAAQGDPSASPSEVALGKRVQPSVYFEDGRMADQSPMAISTSREKPPLLTRKFGAGEILSAPPEPHQPHHKLSINTPQIGHSLDVGLAAGVPRGFKLDGRAPFQALKNKSEDVLGNTPTSQARKEQSEPLPVTSSLRPVKEVAEVSQTPTGEQDAPDAASQQQEDALWGEAFPVQWIRTDRLPFNRTRHLRNPWNHGREVKVSRDGTELEPSVGKALLEEWNRPVPSPPSSPVAGSRPNAPRRGSRLPQPNPLS